MKKFMRFLVPLLMILVIIASIGWYLFVYDRDFTRDFLLSQARYQDMYGNVHIFKSRDLYFDPTDLFKDQMVKVYVDGDNYKRYYVDIDEVLPNVIEY